MTNHHYYLGCPIWGNRDWIGELFSADARPRDFLEQYATVFSAVEGNSTFYGLPAAPTVERWRAQTPPSFRFCFKFPREISHDARLKEAGEATERFLSTLAPLDRRLGPLWLQLPPSFGPDGLPLLDDYLSRLPETFSYGVEVRHPAFFDQGPHEQALRDLLRRRHVNQVVMDVRPLRSGPAVDAAAIEARRRKPDLPRRTDLIGPHPFVRYIAHPDPDANDAFLAEWAVTVAAWISAGRLPYFIVHAPDDFYAPRLARLFHQHLAALVPTAPLPPFPADRPPDTPEQLRLL